MRLIRLALLAALAALPSFALAPFNISCQKGAQKVQTSAIPSTNTFQQSFAGATVTVYIHGGAVGVVSTSGTAVTWVSGTQFNANSDWNGVSITINAVSYAISTVSDTTHLTLGSSAGTQTSVAYSIATAKAPIFSDYAGNAPQSNPLTCNATAGFLVYSPNSIVDETFSGTGVGSPFTMSSVSSIDPISTTTGFITYNASIGTAAAQCTAAHNASQTLIVPQVMASLTTQSMLCSLQFQGGMIQPASGQTVTISGTVTAPSSKIFDYSAGGTVSLTGRLPVVDVAWFGVTCNGSTDDSAAFTAASTALAPGGTLTVPSGKTCNVGTTGFTIKTKQTLEGDGATISHSGTGYAITPLVVANVYASSVVVRNISISTTSTGGCLNWKASYSRLDNVICTQVSGAGSVGLLLPGDSNGTGPYYNEFVGFYQQSQTDHATQVGIKMTCASTRCPNTNHFFGGRTGQGSVGAYVAGDGNSLHGTTFELDTNSIGVEVTADSVSSSLFGGYYEAGGGVTGATAIKVDSGAQNTVSILPYMTGLGCGGCAFVTDAGTNTTLIDSSGQLGPSAFPNIIDKAITGTVGSPVCASTTGQLGACFPMTTVFDGTLVLNSGAGATSPFYIPFAGSTGPFGSASAAATEAIPNHTYLPTFTYADIVLSSAPAVNVTFALAENGTAEAFGCTILSGQTECLTTTPYTKQSSTAGIAWKVSWSGSTLLGAAVRVSIAESAY